ncbi:MAG: carboxypeptidase-like regulatory domain-containing protein [Pseudomonadota bacterium]|nr:carboxypeptidase-like regulatory domain-containing protein [Pseudomonadota bacterium]
MERRHCVALSLGFVLCLVLLDRWVLGPDQQDDEPPDQQAALEQSTLAVPLAAAPDDSLDATSPVPFDSGAHQDAADTGVFRGRIVDAVTRQPVREFELEFHLAGPKPDSPQPPLHTFKTDDGRFRAGSLSAGSWTVLATARGYQRFELTDVQISVDKATAEVLIPMRPGNALRGRVFDESTNAGIAGAQVTFREAHVGRYEGNFRVRPATLSQKDGAFVLDGLPAGPVVVTVSAQKYGPREVDLMAADKMEPIAIGLSRGGGISGYLAGPDRLTPVAGMVSLINIDESSGTSTRTGTAGEFDFSKLAAGRYRLTARSPGLNGELDVTLGNSERLDGLVIAMRGGRDIRGVVSGLKPEELSITSVSAAREGLYGTSVDAMVDERGAYALQGVMPGRVRLSANVRSNRHISKVVEMPADTDLTVNLQFPRGSRLNGRVTRAGKPVSGAMLNASAVAVTTQEEVFLHDVLTSANGDYAIDDMPHGEYTLWVESYRTPVVRVAGDTVFDVEIPSAQLAGRLLEEGGKVPVVGANIDVWSVQPGAARIRTSAQSDHFGQFALRGLQPGDFVVSAYKPGFELYRGPLAYGSPVSDFAISLRPARGVEIRVRDAISGKALNAVTAMEIIGGSPGIVMQMNLDHSGVGYLPSGIAGSALRIFAMGYVPVQLAAWNGEALEVSLQRQAP